MRRRRKTLPYLSVRKTKTLLSPTVSLCGRQTRFVLQLSGNEEDGNTSVSNCESVRKMVTLPSPSVRH